MTAYNPRTAEEIYESLKTRLQNRIPKLTNFIETSFNYVFTRSYSEQQHKVETAAAAVQLSGWADYVGKRLTQEDLNVLGIDGTNPLEINQYIESSHLDEFGKAFGVTRDQGSRATGTLNVTTLQTTTVPEGTEFGTQPDENDEFISFETTETISISGAQTDFPVPVRAINRGTDGNVASNTVTYLPNPPVGVDSVTNIDPISGGVGVQSDSSLREDIKNAVSESAEGGTTSGIEAYIENTTDAISVIVQQKYTGDSIHGPYPHADVVVYGGTDANVEEAIEFAHPSGVQHILVRPEIISISIDVSVEGNDINSTQITQQLEELFETFDLGQDVFEDKVIQVIMNSDTNIENISSLDIKIENEQKTFTDVNVVYELSKTVAGGDTIGDSIYEVTGTLNESPHTFTEDVDYEEYNSTQESAVEPYDSINWGIGGDNPDNNTDFFVSYIVEKDIDVLPTEVAQLESVNVTTQ